MERAKRREKIREKRGEGEKWWVINVAVKEGEWWLEMEGVEWRESIKRVGWWRWCND